jgi:hypothetical protein
MIYVRATYNLEVELDWCFSPGFHTVEDGGIYLRHEFDMGGYSPINVNLFLVLKI